jgi:hypothetical protein
MKLFRRLIPTPRNVRLDALPGNAVLLAEAAVSQPRQEVTAKRKTAQFFHCEMQDGLAHPAAGRAREGISGCPRVRQRASVSLGGASWIATEKTFMRAVATMFTLALVVRFDGENRRSPEDHAVPFTIYPGGPSSPPRG